MALFCGLVVFGEPFTINTALGAILIIGGGAIPSIKGMVAGRKQKQRDEISENLTARLDQEPQQTGVSAELAAAPAPSVALTDAEPLKITESLTHIATKMEFEPAKSEDELQAVFVEQGLQGFPAKLDIVERTEDHVQMMSLQELLRFAKASNVGAVTYDVTYFPHADNAEVEYQLHQLHATWASAPRSYATCAPTRFASTWSSMLSVMRARRCTASSRRTSEARPSPGTA